MSNARILCSESRLKPAKAGRLFLVLSPSGSRANARSRKCESYLSTEPGRAGVSPASPPVRIGTEAGGTPALPGDPLAWRSPYSPETERHLPPDFEAPHT